MSQQGEANLSGAMDKMRRVASPSRPEEMVQMKISYVTVLVKDQNAALRFYTQKLGWEMKEDDKSVPGMRWLSVAPKGTDCVRVVLSKPAAHKGDGGIPGMTASKARQLLSMVGKNPTWVIETDDCKRDYDALKAKGVKFTSPPMDMPWGVSCVFVDLYGNPYNMVQPKPRAA